MRLCIRFVSGHAYCFQLMMIIPVGESFSVCRADTGDQQPSPK